ncbi:MAG: hypothetical protein EXQ58_10515 [Acidobacteria bacterium]|nr:hypothetical protein [Acidobacteriota bacterium]
MNLTDLSAAQLRKAASIKEQIEKLQGELALVLGTTKPAPATAPAPKKQTMSTEAKAHLSAKLKRIWAERKAAQQATVVQKPAIKKQMSPAAKALISAKLKAAWAKRKAAKKG